jgi:uncharacterized protein YjbI with pentapeptide repeats
MANSEHLDWIKRGIEGWNRWRKDNPNISPNLWRAGLSGANLRRADLSGANLKRADLSGADLGGANLSGANLSGASLSGANLSGASLSRVDLSGASLSRVDLSRVDLSGANLSEANLSGTNLSGADLSEVNLSKTYLKRANLKWVNLSEANLSEANLSEANLKRANLKWANLSGANLSGANLSGANLKAAHLVTVQALGTDFTGASLTGGCIQDWHINSATKLEEVDCKYVYLKTNQQERRPIGSSQTFAPGEFTKLFQKAQETIDLLFRNGLDWMAFAASFQKVQIENEADELAIASIENMDDGVVVVRVRASPDADKPKIHADFTHSYEESFLKVLVTQQQAHLKDKDRHINQLFALLQQCQVQNSEVTKLMIETPKYDQRGSTFGNFADTVQAGSKQQNIQHIYHSEHKQTLATAAAEIQALLQQLRATNQTASEEEQKAYVNLSIPPVRRTRIVSALQAGGEAAIGEIPYGGKIIKAILEDWRKSG